MPKLLGVALTLPVQGRRVKAVLSVTARDRAGNRRKRRITVRVSG